MTKNVNFRNYLLKVFLYLIIFVLLENYDFSNSFLFKYRIAVYLLLILTVLFLLDNLKAFKNKDIFLCEIITSLIINYLIIISFPNLFRNIAVKYILINCSYILLLIVILFDLANIFKKRNENCDKNSLSIEQLYKLNQNEIDNNTNLFKNKIFITDEIPNEDILDREFVVDSLCEVINSFSPSGHYVIGLRGEWGSGKSTIINFVKDSLDKDSYGKKIIFIDGSFIWTCTDPNNLLLTFYDKLCSIVPNNTLYFYSLIKYRKKLLKVLSNYNILFDLFNNDIDISKIKKMISDFISESNYKLVFVIDNFERSAYENILLTLKMINSIFNINGVIYILSFDEIVLKNIFNNNQEYSFEFIDKIIQFNISVPYIRDELYCDIVKKCLNNIFAIVKLNDVEEEKIKLVISSIIKQFNTIRDLCVYFNKVLQLLYLNGYDEFRTIDIIDLLLINIIECKNIELYNEIYNNMNYYVKSYSYVDDNIIKGYKIDETLARDYFANVRGKEMLQFKKYEDILFMTFPNIKGYFYNTTSSREIDTRFNGLNNLTNFKIYFFKNLSKVDKYKKYIMKNIKYIVQDDFKKIIEESDYYLHFLAYCKNINGELNEIELRKTLQFVFNSYYEFCNYNTKSYDFSIMEKIAICTSTLLMKISFNYFIDFVNVNKSFRNLYYFYIISENCVDEARKNIIIEIYNGLKDEIITNKINIYDVENYAKFNYALFKNEKEYVDYLKQIIISKNCLLLFLADRVKSFIQNGKKYYYFKRSEIEEFYDYSIIKLEIIKYTNCKLKEFLIKLLNANEHHNDYEDGQILIVEDNDAFLDKYIYDYIAIKKLMIN